MRTLKSFINEEEKKNKKDVDYSKGMQKSHCGICEHYHNNACSKVKGYIDPSYWCKLFELKD